MSSRQTNKLKWRAELLVISEEKNTITDRIQTTYKFVRRIPYNNIGVTAYDKFTTRETNEVVKKIEIRLDRVIEENQKQHRFQIGRTIYDIERVYVREEERIMEVSLTHVH